MDALLWPLVAFIGGVLARIVIPYLLEWVNTPGVAFDWRYLIGQILAAIIALIPVTFNDQWLATIGGLSWASAVGAGWLAADLGREAQKIYDVVRNRTGAR